MREGGISVRGTSRYCGPFDRAWCDLLPEPPKVIFDVGANDGGDSHRFKSWFPEARVVTVEPHPHWAELLRQDGLEVYELVASDRNGEIDFYLGDMQDGAPGPSGSIYRVNDEQRHALREWRSYAYTPLRMKTERLDSLCARIGVAAIDILHIDTEGAEYDVVVGLGEMRPRIVLGEMCLFKCMQDCPHTRDDMYALMTERGYRILEDSDTDTAWILE